MSNARDNANVPRLATAQASTSGTSRDFTGIPSWAKKITVMLNGVSLSAAANLLIQIGNNTPETTGYNSSNLYSFNAAVATYSSTAGFMMASPGATATFSGAIVLTTLGSNVWVAQGVVKAGTSTAIAMGGDKTTSGTVNMVRLTSSSTDTFDAGSVNILYE